MMPRATWKWPVENKYIVRSSDSERGILETVATRLEGTRVPGTVLALRNRLRARRDFLLWVKQVGRLKCTPVRSPPRTNAPSNRLAIIRRRERMDRVNKQDPSYCQLRQINRRFQIPAPPTSSSLMGSKKRETSAVVRE